MAKFLTTNGIAFEIEQTLRSASKSLTLISPYLQISEMLLERLRDADRRSVRITIVYGKNKLNDSEQEKLGQIPNLELYFLGNLHAKCYLNETRAVVGSMNMYEYSEKNNREAGILLTSEEDPRALQELFDEAESIINNAEHKTSRRNADQRPRERRERQRPSTRPDVGHCIRCGKSIALDPMRPHCDECFEVWVQWGNEEFPERFCHACKSSVQTTRSRPLCHRCYRGERGERGIWGRIFG